MPASRSRAGERCYAFLSSFPVSLASKARSSGPRRRVGNELLEGAAAHGGPRAEIAQLRNVTPAKARSCGLPCHQRVPHPDIAAAGAEVTDVDTPSGGPEGNGLVID